MSSRFQFSSVKLDEALKKHTLSTSPRTISEGNDVVYLIGVEGDAPNPSWSWPERFLDRLVQTFQPAPVLTHVEIFVPPSFDGTHVNFATYIGKTANWQPCGDAAAQKFYLIDNADAWRAIPIFDASASKRLVDEAQFHIGTPYSLARYAWAIPPLRNFACVLPSTIQSPGHCATVSARLLERALPSVKLQKPAAYYGPSSLFIELSRKKRMQTYADHLDRHVGVSNETGRHAQEILIRHSDEEVRRLSSTECAAAIELLTARACRTTASGDPTVARIAQKQLAKALLRWSLISTI